MHHLLLYFFDTTHDTAQPFVPLSSLALLHGAAALHMADN